jgi:uncharacterized protein YcnI
MRPKGNPMNTSIIRRTLTAAATAVGSAALLLTAAAGASAHVGVTPDKTTANSYALLTFGVPHGCDDSATTKVAITLPAELNDAQPTVNPNWIVEKVTEQLAEPKKLADGTSITRRTSQIVYTAKTPLADDLRDALVLSLKLPDAAGTTLYFPTLQTCETGQTDWAEIAKDGQDPHSLKAPAPSITITEAASPDGHGAATAGTVAHSTGPSSAGTDTGADARSWAGLAAGIGGLGLGGLALARSRRNAGGEATAK